MFFIIVTKDVDLTENKKFPNPDQNGRDKIVSDNQFIIDELAVLINSFLLIYDLKEKKTLVCSKNSVDLIKYEYSYIEKHPLERIIHEEDFPLIDQGIQHAKQQENNAFYFECRIKNKKKGYIWMGGGLKIIDRDEEEEPQLIILNFYNTHKKSENGEINVFDNQLEFIKNNLPVFFSLTDREKEILYLIIQDNNSIEISEKLFISKQTVDTHRKKIMKKLNATGTVGLAKFAIFFDI